MVCKICGGSGVVVDYVDFGSTVVSMTQTCECFVPACPVCGQPDPSYLTWNEDGETITCMRCGAIYTADGTVIKAAEQAVTVKG